MCCVIHKYITKVLQGMDSLAVPWFCDTLLMISVTKNKTKQTNCITVWRNRIRGNFLQKLFWSGKEYGCCFLPHGCVYLLCGVATDWSVPDDSEWLCICCVVLPQIGQYLMTLPQHLDPFTVQDSPALTVALRHSKLPYTSEQGISIALCVCVCVHVCVCVMCVCVCECVCVCDIYILVCVCMCVCDVY